MSTLDGAKRFPVLYVDDEDPNLVVFKASFQNEFDIVCSSSPEEALHILQERNIAVLLADQRMPGMSGIELCQLVRERHPNVVRLLVTAYSDQQTAISAINHGGVLRYLTKPWSLDEVRLVLRDAVARAQLEHTVRTMRAAILDRERLAAVASMSANLLHDLGNLDTVVAGSCLRLELLLDPVADHLPEDLMDEMDGAVRSLRKAVDHINDLHDQKRQTAKLSPMSSEYLQLRDVLETVWELVRNELSGFVTVELDCPSDTMVWADRIDISRILMNLLTNAQQSIEAAGLSDAGVRVSATKTGNIVAISVRDGGPGIPRSLADRIFEPAVTTKKERGGNGLGLSICRELAKANGGSIELVSEPDAREAERVPAHFVLKIPAQDPAEA